MYTFSLHEKMLPVSFTCTCSLVYLDTLFLWLYTKQTNVTITSTGYSSYGSTSRLSSKKKLKLHSVTPVPLCVIPQTSH